MIGARIRQARMRAGPDGRGMTQAALAAALDVVRSHVTNVENGKDKLSLEKLEIVAAETNTTVAWLIGEDLVAKPGYGHADLIAAYNALDEEHRHALLTMAKGLARSGVATQPTAPKKRTKSRKAATIVATAKRKRAACIIPIERFQNQ